MDPATSGHCVLSRRTFHVDPATSGLVSNPLFYFDIKRSLGRRPNFGRVDPDRRFEHVMTRVYTLDVTDT